MRTLRCSLLLAAIVWLVLLTACGTSRIPSPPANTPTPDLVASVLAPTSPATSEGGRPLFDGWSVLIFSGADANRAPLTAAELVAATNGAAQLAVQIVVATPPQANATDALSPGRYLRDGARLVPVASGLSPTPDAASLADFVTWGSGTLPAQRTALIVGGYDVVHTLAATEIAAALRAAQLATGAPPLDLIVLDAALSARLDLLVALREVARYAIVTGEPLLTGPLAGLPLDGVDSAPAAAFSVAAQLVSARGSGDTPWAVVDLAQIGAVGDALEMLAGTLGGQIGISGAPLARAIDGAALLPDLNGAPGTRSPVALGGLTAALATATALPANARAAAEALRTAQGAALPLTTGPVAADFPLVLPAIPPTGGAASILPAWHALLDALPALNVPAPAITLLAAPTLSSTVDSAQPALLRVEFSGRQIDTLALVAGARDDNGYRLGFYEPLSAPSAGWADGVYSTGAVWPVHLAQLSADNGTAPVVGWPLASGGRVVAGALTDDGGGRSPSVLVFDDTTGRPLRAWRSAGYPQAEPLTPQRQFAPLQWTIDASGALTATEGVPLAVGSLRLVLQPAAAGEYFVGIRGRSLAGAHSAALRDITLSAAPPITGYQPFVDPTYGFRLLYPDGWRVPAALDAAGSLFASSDVSATQTLQIKAYAAGEIISGTQSVPLSAATIKAAVLAQWQDVAIVYEDATTVGGEFALRTAYGYIGAEGERRGVLLTFIHKEIGYAIDLDLPAVDADALLPLADALAAGWLFVPYALTPDAGRFATLTSADGQIIVPEGFAFETLDNGWQRYRDRRDGRRFFALRSDPPGDGDAAAVARGWLDVVAQDVADIAISDPAGFALAGQAWSRYDFRYTAANGAPIRGLLMSSVSDSERVVWAEAPEVDWAAFVETVLAIVSTAYDAPR